MKDANGNELKVGDIVLVEATVSEIHEDCCEVLVGDSTDAERCGVFESEYITKKPDPEIRTDPALMAAAPEPEVGPMDPALFCPR